MGIHHVTAISGAPERNLDFYNRVLGLRLVKKTVNFDDPGTYHLYYGDEQGAPGTILTFFPWAHAAQGRRGTGETQETAFRVPAVSLGYWAHRFVEKGVTHGALEKRFDETVLPFADHDGMQFALVGSVGVAGAENEKGWSGGVPTEHAIRGFDGVPVMLGTAAPTARVLTDVLGFRPAGEEGALTRYVSGEALRGDGTLRAGGESPRGQRARARRAPARHARPRLGASRRVPRRERRRTGRDGGKGGRARAACHRAEGPQLFLLGLFPRAGRRAVRASDRRSGLRGGRAGGQPRPRAEAAALSRTAPRRTRGQAAAA